MLLYLLLCSLHLVAAIRPDLVRLPLYQHLDDTVYDGWLYGLIPPGQPHYVNGQTRPSGTLLLNMLVKNEEVHLNRTLPLWAKMIDAWIIGVDENNTDQSIEVIERHLGHLPGHIVTLPFNGMGPTWSVLVKEGLHEYPTITHGILADADFTPLGSRLDRHQLDVRCSKHMYTIINSDRTSSRLMDWIYRNIAHVNVTRRTHQTLNAPALPDQQVFQTLVSLTIEEHEGGYGDRTGQKDLRYISLLEADLIDYPNDDRTLYYLAIAHLNLALQSTPPSSSPHLQTSVDYFKRRTQSTEGNSEERWFAVLKLAEINERYLFDYDQSMVFYRQAMKLDPERADSFFYAGQRLRLSGQPEKALEYLESAAIMPQPQRSLFQWHFLYVCLAKLEFAEAVVMMIEPKQSQVKKAQKLIRDAQCQQEGRKEQRKSELISLLKTQRKITIKKQPHQAPSTNSDASQPNARHSKVSTVDVNDHQRRVDLLNQAIDAHLSIESSLSSQPTHEIWWQYMQQISALSDAVSSSDVDMNCRNYRRTSLPYLRWLDQNEGALFDVADTAEVNHAEWKELYDKMRNECR